MYDFIRIGCNWHKYNSNVDINFGLSTNNIYSRRNRDTHVIDYSQFIITTSGEHIAALKQKQERQKKIEKEKEKRKAYLEINKSQKTQQQQEKQMKRKLGARNMWKNTE